MLVGLTIRPARPGPNEVLVFLLPLDGEDAAAGLPATIRVGERSVQMDPCGGTCRRAELDLQGGEQISVQVGSEVGGTAPFRLPDLPARDGSELFDQAQRRIHELRSFRLEEVLSSGLATVRSTYAFEAPDSFAAKVIRQGVTVSETILIGGTRYLRSPPEGSWKKQTGGPGLDVPRFVWDSFLPAVSPRLIGTDMVGGVPTEVISLSGTGSLSIWFRLWVDDQGLVRKAEMRAQGHFMDHRYFAFDTPIDIEPPTGA